MPSDLEAYVRSDAFNIINVNVGKSNWLKKRSIKDFKILLTHESLHSASRKFSAIVDNNLNENYCSTYIGDTINKSIILNEGFAEYFTEKLMGKPCNGDDKYYSYYLNFAKAIVADIGEYSVQKAFFTGDNASIAKVKKSLEKFIKTYVP